MDKNAQFIVDKKVERTIESFKKHNMDAYFVKDKSSLINKISEILEDGNTVSVGGSMTLFETGVIDFLRSGKYNFWDRYKEGLTPEGIKNVFRQSFSSDAYLVSSNAITEEGELYNVDGNGNRVAAMLYGPDKVIVVVGYNKIVKNIDEAMKRKREIAAPANCKRLSKKTPCAEVGYCMDCKSPDRLCNDYVVIKRQAIKGRIHVLILGEDFGY
jgi:L-lactate utilization protein LutB